MNGNQRKNAIIIVLVALCVLTPLIVMATRGVNRALAEVEASIEVRRTALDEVLAYYQVDDPRQPLEKRQ